MMTIWVGIAPGPRKTRVIAMHDANETLLKARLLRDPAPLRALPLLFEANASQDARGGEGEGCREIRPDAPGVDSFLDPLSAHRRPLGVERERDIVDLGLRVGNGAAGGSVGLIAHCVEKTRTVIEVLGRMMGTTFPGTGTAGRLV